MELRNEDLNHEEFQLYESYQNSYQAHKLVREEDININWSDDDEVEVEKKAGEEDVKRGDEKVEGFGDDDGKRELFGSKGILSQKAVNNLARKYNISNIYFCKALEKGECMFDPKLREIDVSTTHLEAELGSLFINSLFSL